MRHADNRTRADGSPTTGHGQLTLGMAVVGSDLNSIGTGKETRGEPFLLDRPLRRDVWAPLSAVRSVSADQVMLACAASEVNDQDWTSPPLMGGNTDDSAVPLT